MTHHPTYSSSLAEPGQTPAGAPAHMYLDTRRFVRFLAYAACVMAVVGAFANIVIYQIAETPEANLARVMSRFDLGHEPSLPAWFSSMVLLLNGAMLLLIGRAKRASSRPFAMHWLVLGVIFVGLSIDEAVMFHEMIDKLISFGVSTDGFLLFPWAVVGLTFALIVFGAYYRFLAHLPLRFAALFIVSGSLFVGGAVGMEFIAGSIIDQHGVESIYHTIIQTIEESLEMAGSILFFYALTEYWTWSYGGISLKTAELGKS